MTAHIPNHAFTGIAAADLNDRTSLQQFLDSRGVDTTRYEPLGAGFSVGPEDAFSGFIACKDHQRSTEEREHLIDLHFEKKMTKEEFFSLFKRFEILVTEKHRGYEAAEMNGELVIAKLEE